VHFIPVHIHPYYRNKYRYGAEQFPIAFSNYERLVSLPLSPKLTDDDVADVIEAVEDILVENAR
jgi:dTDP-4-amino-4,6-dideoxygalactose transaminase